MANNEQTWIDILLGNKYAIGIFQLNNEHTHLMFEAYDEINKQNQHPQRNNYDIVYAYETDETFVTDKYCLDNIWDRFNIARPSDFKGHSLSVSDIIVLKNDKEITACYVDVCGFKHVQNFNIVT